MTDFEATLAQPLAIEGGGFLADVLTGLSLHRKSVPCKWLYDRRGAWLFERICDLGDYYPTRCETAILESHVQDIATLLGPDCLLVEYGSGSSTKTDLLLNHLDRPAGYVPIDIAGDAVHAATRRLADRHPHLDLMPIIGDFTGAVVLPRPHRTPRRTAIFFPGSTIGNFTEDEALALLADAAERCGTAGVLVIGIDLDKDPRIIERAYNDAPGVTAAFNLNLLARINRELAGDIRMDTFVHRAPFDILQRRIEMQLVSSIAQTVHVAGQPFHFAADEVLVSEHSHKYTTDGFAALAARAGWELDAQWVDADGWFCVQCYHVCGKPSIHRPVRQ